MAVDALDPGPNGDYPYFPRDTEGKPLTSHSQAKTEDAGTYRPTGLHTENGVLLDLTPTGPDGQPIEPPTIPPAA